MRLTLPLFIDLMNSGLPKIPLGVFIVILSDGSCPDIQFKAVTFCLSVAWLATLKACVIALIVSRSVWWLTCWSLLKVHFQQASCHLRQFHLTAASTWGQIFHLDLKRLRETWHLDYHNLIMSLCIFVRWLSRQPQAILMINWTSLTTPLFSINTDETIPPTHNSFRTLLLSPS